MASLMRSFSCLCSKQRQALIIGGANGPLLRYQKTSCGNSLKKTQLRKQLTSFRQNSDQAINKYHNRQITFSVLSTRWCKETAKML